MAAAQPPPPSASWATIPQPVRHLFDLFPLSTLPAEPLPARAPSRSRARPVLYVFGRGDPSAGRPSFNPSCLKWQTFLRIAGVQTDLVHSNNHASPSGALPFLLPPTTTPSSSSTTFTTATTTTTTTLLSSSSSPPKASQPLTGAQIARYARAHSSTNIPPDPARAEPYSALIAQRIRPAWLYTLYLLPANLPLLSSLYLPASPLVALPALHSLRRAATAEILSTTRRPALSPPTLLSDARDALAALAALLADDEWFFGAKEPGLFDAEVFAYTHLVLDAGLGWGDDALARCVAGLENLVGHRERLYRRCWPE